MTWMGSVFREDEHYFTKMSCYGCFAQAKISFLDLFGILGRFLQVCSFCSTYLEPPQAVGCGHLCPFVPRVNTNRVNSRSVYFRQLVQHLGEIVELGSWLKSWKSDCWLYGFQLAFKKETPNQNQHTSDDKDSSLSPAWSQGLHCEEAHEVSAATGSCFVNLLELPDPDPDSLRHMLELLVEDRPRAVCLICLARR